MNTQPEALRLADRLHEYWDSYDEEYHAASELRRLHEVNQELVEALQEMVSQFDQFNLIDCEERAIKEARAALAKVRGTE